MEPARVLDFAGKGALRCAANTRERFRQMIHDEVDKWVDELLVLFEEDREPTIEEISELLTVTRQKFMARFAEHIITQKYAELLAQEHCACPQCGKLCKARRQVRKKIDTMHGKSSLERPWFYCTHCDCGFSPLDSVLELSRKEKQLDIQKKCIKLAAHVPFSCASAIFEDLTGQPVSDHCIHETFEQVGAHAQLEEVIPGREQIEERIRDATTGKWRPVLVVVSDGANLPTRPRAPRAERRGSGRYQEAKGFRLYLVAKDRMKHLASWHQIQNEAQFGEDLAMVAQRVPQEKVRIALLGDGADWLWKHMTACFPRGRQVLDYYHCAEHLYEVGKAQYGEKSPEALPWVEATLCSLFYAEIDNVIGSLQRMEPRNDQAAELIRKLIGYLNNNRHRIHYRSDRLGGYPIGSGAIESANKFICHTRMKRSGAWWVKENGNAMLRIRCSLYNGTFDRVFDRYKRAECAKTGHADASH
jgi:hypothetical protein